MNAETLAFAIDPRARRYGRNWRTRCPAHDDQHPSLDIRDGHDGQVLWVDRAACGQGEILDALVRLGLWRPVRESAFRPRRFSWLDYCAARPATIKGHQRMGREYELAFLRGQLDAAGLEIRGLYRTAKERITPDDLERELRLALSVGGIGAGGLPAPLVEAAIKNFCGGCGVDDVGCAGN